MPGSNRTWAILGVIGTFAAVVIALLPYWGVHPQTPASRPPTSTSADASHDVPDGSGGDAGCRSAGGAAIGCAASGSGLIVTVTTCTPSAVRDAWGYAVGVPLAVTTASIADGCLVLPSTIAAAAGATGADLAEAAQGRIESRLLMCARADGTTAASCATPHEYEWVSEWTSLAAAKNPETWCHDLVTSYTANALGSGSRLRSNVFTSSEGTRRCAASAGGSTLTASLWHIGGTEIPLG